MHPLRLLLLAHLALLLSAPLLRAEPIPDPLYETRSEHDPNGIGKFFLGREIAHVMGHQAWGWLERPEREEEERTDLLLEALAIQPGQTVADIGAGSGYFSWRMARKVGDEGRVLAVDIQSEMLEMLMRNMAMRRVEKRVKPVLGTITDPKLPPNSCDLMLMVDVYHEFDHPFEMITAMISALKPGGRLVYSVCTLTRSETTAVTAAFSAAHPELEPLPLTGLGSPHAELALLPHELNANGMFIATWLRKK
jgi:16S rRNA C967 or C1407 C5-methylase (RsmB/RsmF family)